METKTKKSLLERYGIPINHLDFQYIKECNDGREMEKIVHILRSNEEGYFPDLTKCAEDKLRELKPQSRLFRVEEKIKGREALNSDEIKPIYDWNHDIKSTDKQLLKLVKENALDAAQLPPIRQGGRILQTKNQKEETNKSGVSNKESQRIKSTDYSKWDKYDAEEEILRLDLAAEREQEDVERKNRLNMEKCLKKPPLTITEITDDKELGPLEKWSNLTDIEKEKLSEEYRLRGNEYFRSKEYDNALEEYSRAIEICPHKAVAAYNNRALTFFKLQKFLDSIKDCEKCLSLEPSNLKARLRLAEASYSYGRKRESYQLYIDVLQLDAENSVALKATTELRKQFEDLPPPNATRLKIQDESSKNKPAIIKETSKPQPKPKAKEYDLAELVKPNRLVKNKFIKAAETLSKNIPNTKDNKNISQKKVPHEIDKQMQIQLPGTYPAHSELKGKKLIQEL
ncbi:sperm-associated antigen 1 [Lucilia cuprina]|uniref:sperm-associated antigen 1 n=1 Tax=Lucilia cuprina TaxID=7375 RepID=UPI001F05AFE5|nr:sperm-associated antigen 1 [Lucilia cuprina]